MPGLSARFEVKLLNAQSEFPWVSLPCSIGGPEPGCAGMQLPALNALFEHPADAVYLLDPETSNIVWGNRAAWESLGLTRDQVLDHSVLSLQMDVTGAPQWSDIAAVIRSRSCFTFVGRHRHADGHEVPVEVNTTHFTEGGAASTSCRWPATSRAAWPSRST